MSWLQNLAKQGESFLDRLDQQAGAAIEQVEQKIQDKKDDKLVNQSMDRGRGTDSPNRSPRMDRHVKNSMNKTGSFDARFGNRSLYSNSPTDPNMRASPLLIRSISQSSRLSSMDKRDLNQLEVDSPDLPDGLQLMGGIETPPSGRTSPPENSESEFEVVSGPGSVVGGVMSTSQSESIDLQLENRLLRQELNALNMEITRLIDTQKKSDRELELQNQELLRRRRSESEQTSETIIKEREKHLRDIDLKESQFESEKSSLSEALSSTQITLQREKTRTQELTTQCRTLKVSFENLKNDSDDYKLKAQRILQSKDQIIENLRNQSGEDIDENKKSGQSDYFHSQVELEEIKGELEILKDENRSYKIRIENLRAELHQTETQGAQDYEIVESKAFDLENSNTDLKQSNSNLESELINIKAELKQCQDDFASARQGLRERLTAKDQEIGKIRSELMNKSSDRELERRLRALTETVISKQTTIEALSVDKSSLTLELERYKRNQSVSINTAPVLRNRRNADFDYESEPLISDNKDDAVGKIKRAVGAVDKLSIRIGILLKRYPTLRLLVILYMIMLHIWTSVVLVTYEPEIHSHTLDSDPTFRGHQAAVGIDKQPLEDD